MITDFIQGMFANLTFLALMVFVFIMFRWSHIVEAMQLAAEPGKSMLNPYDTGRVQHFNFMYYAIAIFGAIYRAGAWRGASGYAGAAKSPHEARMAGLLGLWRGQAQTLTIFILPLVAYMLMNHPSYRAVAQATQESLSQIADPQLQKQATVTLALSKVIPVGLAGLFVAVMFAAMLSTDDTYMHSWGTTFIQDVILPFRKGPFSPKIHLLLLKGSIVFVGVFAFLFSCLYRQTEHILLYFAITGAIFTGGAGSAIIGGLYWRKGTTQAAWAAMITGSILALSGIVLQQHNLFHIPIPGWFLTEENRLLLDGQQMMGVSMVCSIVVYVLISLLTCKEDFNLEKMLHRGKYDVKGEHSTKTTRIFDLRRLGVTDEFTKSDKLLYYSVQGWTLGWALFFLGVTAYHYLGWRIGLGTLTDAFWIGFWKFKVFLAFGLGVVTTIWFTIGGILDVRRLFKALATIQRDDADDGRVVHGHLSGEDAIERVDNGAVPDAPAAADKA